MKKLLMLYLLLVSVTVYPQFESIYKFHKIPIYTYSGNIDIELNKMTKWLNENKYKIKVISINIVNNHKTIRERKDSEMGYHGYGYEHAYSRPGEIIIIYLDEGNWHIPPSNRRGKLK